MKLLIVLKNEVGGYWDGGSKKSFEWDIYNYNRPQKDKNGFFVKVGSFEANHWFMIGAGKTKLQTERQILTNAKNKLLKTLYNKDILVDYAIINND